MNPFNKLTINIISVSLIFYGLIKALLNAKQQWSSFMYLCYSIDANYFFSELCISSLQFLQEFIFPISAIYGGINLIKLKKRGWIISIFVTLLFFMINLAWTISFVIASYHYRNIHLPPIPEGPHVVYMKTLFSLVFIFLLRRKQLQELCVN